MTLRPETEAVLAAMLEQVGQHGVDCSTPPHQLAPRYSLAESVNTLRAAIEDEVQSVAFEYAKALANEELAHETSIRQCEKEKREAEKQGYDDGVVNGQALDRFDLEATIANLRKSADACHLAASENAQRANEAEAKLLRVDAEKREYAEAAVARVRLERDAPDLPIVIPDEHPEGRCQACGGRNVSWCTESPTWNAVIRTPEEVPSEPMLCPTCFMRKAALTWPHALWTVYREDWAGANAEAAVAAYRDEAAKALRKAVEEWDDSHDSSWTLPIHDIIDGILPPTTAALDRRLKEAEKRGYNAGVIEGRVLNRFDHETALATAWSEGEQRGYDRGRRDEQAGARESYLNTHPTAPEILAAEQRGGEPGRAEEREALLHALVQAAIPLEALHADNQMGARWMAPTLRAELEKAVHAVRAAVAERGRKENLNE